jgi:hypothetical protein
MNAEQLKKIRQLLSTQRFADWYTTGNFDKWTTGDLKHETQKSQEECDAIIDKDIERLFGNIFE